MASQSIPSSLSFCATKVDFSRIQPLRELFLREANFQVRYNACHERGWSDSYLLSVGGTEVGYGSVKGDKPTDRDRVFEFYVIPPFRRQASFLFRELLAAAQARLIECQSNDPMMSSMLFEFACNINSEVVLFEHHATTNIEFPGAVFRPKRDDDRIFKHQVEPAGDYVLILGGQIVATGGFLLHYNKPFADLYMEVEQNYRRKGAGSFLIQEIIKQSYVQGRVPAARCNISNIASRATLTKAGMRTCGFMLVGDVRNSC